jgi:hypothetical protein
VQGIRSRDSYFDVRPWDPLMLLGAALLLGLAGLIAGMIPAHRAAKVDPMEQFLLGNHEREGGS